MSPLSVAVRRAALLRGFLRRHLRGRRHPSGENLMLCIVMTSSVIAVLLTATPGVCMSPQPTDKQANEIATLHQAGLNKDRSQIPAMLAALKNPNDPIKRSYTFVALHALVQMGVTEALPPITALLSTSHDASLVNYAAAAKARLLAENGAQAVKRRSMIRVPSSPYSACCAPAATPHKARSSKTSPVT